MRQSQPAVLDPDLATRKRATLEALAEHGGIGHGLALSMAATGRMHEPKFDAAISETLDAIRERRDCSDFAMPAVLWLYGAFKDELPAKWEKEIRETALGYRYWVDEPGNDVMWFWTENHVLCFHVAQFMAGQLFPDATFTCSGRMGREQAMLGEKRLHLWFDAVEEDGLAEWNSPPTWRHARGPTVCSSM